MINIKSQFVLYIDDIIIVALWRIKEQELRTVVTCLTNRGWLINSATIQSSLKFLGNTRVRAARDITIWWLKAQTSSRGFILLMRTLILDRSVIEIIKGWKGMKIQVFWLSVHIFQLLQKWVSNLSKYEIFESYRRWFNKFPFAHHSDKQTLILFFPFA